MQHKFQELVNRQNDILNENKFGDAMNAVGSAVRRGYNAAANNRNVNDFLYGNKQGAAEGGSNYDARLLARGEIRQYLQTYRNYEQGRIPVIMDFDKNYAGKLQPAIEQKVTQILSAGRLQPTITHMNDGLDYTKEANPDGQINFFKKCVERITLTNLSKTKQTNIQTGNFFLRVNNDGVLFRLNEDIESAAPSPTRAKNEPVLYADFASAANGYSLIASDRQVYESNIITLVQPIMSNVIAIIARLQGTDPSILNPKPLPGATATSSAPASGGGSVDPGSGAPESGATPDLIDQMIDTIDTSMPYKNVVSLICHKIHEICKESSDYKISIDSFYNAAAPKNPAAPQPEEILMFANAIGCLGYPDNKQNEETLRTFYYRSIPAAATTASVRGLENDLYFLPPDVIEEVAKAAEEKLGRQAISWTKDKIYNAIKHPFKTIQKMYDFSKKMAGSYGIESMYSTHT